MSAAAQLTTPVQYLKGVGPARAQLLERLELHTAADVLFYFPRSYQDMSELREISQLVEDEPVSVCGVVEEVELRNTAPGRSMLGLLVRQDTYFLRAIWFNQPFMRQRFTRGRRVLLSGTPKRRGNRWEMAHPRAEVLGDDEALPTGRILPVYGLTEGISQWQMRRLVSHTLQQYATVVEEVFPQAFLDEHNLLSIQTALAQIHAPQDQQSLQLARRRFIYQELLVLQLALAVRRWKLTQERQAPALTASTKIDARILRLFPFELTGDQQRSVAEISADMARRYPMNRLLQGEVGSGKTVVAAYAMLLAVAHGYQAAMMAPTEVLARQHQQTLEESLRESKVRIGLLTGGLSAPQRRQTLEAIASGEVDLVIGTHAIVQEGVQFAKLGLVVIDEQHKFGVLQRATLKQAGIYPHYLVMTATPIPRTVSMTVFGDLDVSTIRENPPGRQIVHTYLGQEAQREQWWQFFRKKLDEGRQGFVITPLVDESDVLEVASVERAFEALANGELDAYRLGLIHGRMSAAAKQTAMQLFRSGQTQVLVATSVVEVGVNVPNATVMTIESGQRFGLAQLHQLRGRISRGVHPGYLCVFADAQTAESVERLEAFVRSTDGFELADLDFRLRGPGDLFGTQQHGLPPLRIADLLRDQELLEEARRDARQLAADDVELSSPLWARLRRMVLTRYGRALELGDVG